MSDRSSPSDADPPRYSGATVSLSDLGSSFVFGGRVRIAFGTAAFQAMSTADLRGWSEQYPTESFTIEGVFDPAGVAELLPAELPATGPAKRLGRFDLIAKRLHRLKEVGDDSPEDKG